MTDINVGYRVVAKLDAKPLRYKLSQPCEFLLIYHPKIPKSAIPSCIVQDILVGVESLE
jgi:hypothetical protein